MLYYITASYHFLVILDKLLIIQINEILNQLTEAAEELENL